MRNTPDKPTDAEPGRGGKRGGAREGARGGERGGSAASPDWVAYYDAMEGKGPRETLVRAMELCEASRAARGGTKNGEGGTGGAGGMGGEPLLAVDLGCGEGRDVVALLARGWRVFAIDSHPEGISRVQRRAAGMPGASERLETRVGSIVTTDWPRAGLVNASYVLPFLTPEEFEGVWRRIVGSIEPGGCFAGQFFGLRDSWAGIPGRTHLSRERVEGLFEGFEVEMFQEDDEPGKDGLGFPKHWHRFHVVARLGGGRGAI